MNLGFNGRGRKEEILFERVEQSIADEQARFAWCQPAGLARVPSQQLGAIAGWLAPFCSGSLACRPSPLHLSQDGLVRDY